MNRTTSAGLLLRAVTSLADLLWQGLLRRFRLCYVERVSLIIKIEKDTFRSTFTDVSLKVTLHSKHLSLLALL